MNDDVKETRTRTGASAEATQVAREMAEKGTARAREMMERTSAAATEYGR